MALTNLTERSNLSYITTLKEKPFKLYNIHTTSHYFNSISGRIQVLKDVLIEETRQYNQWVKVCH